MVMPTLADLRYAFFGAGGSDSVSDAEYRQLLALYNQGITLSGLAVKASIADLRTGDAADWTRWLFTSDVNAPDSALSFEHGQAVIRIVGGTGTQSNRREVWTIPNVPASEFSRIKTRCASKPAADGILEHVHMHRLKLEGSTQRAATVWDFGFGNLLCGIWESTISGGSFNVQQAPSLDSEAISAASRTSGVVTATVPSGANTRWRVGDIVLVDGTDNTYDGSFALTAVASTTLTWAQPGVADDAAMGTGTLTLCGRDALTGVSRAYTVTDAARVAGVVTSVGLAAGHAIEVGDWIAVDGTDNVYDGARFPVTAYNIFTSQISWLQAGSDDAAMGSGIITKAGPYWLETELLPNNIMRARAVPDIGQPGAFVGTHPAGMPPWETRWSRTWDLNRVTGATVPTGEGAVAIGAAHGSSNSSARFDNVSAEPLYLLS